MLVLKMLLLALHEGVKAGAIDRFHGKKVSKLSR
jgi:hypothetical protein